MAVPAIRPTGRARSGATNERYAIEDQARAAVFAYIEVFYGRAGPHAGLGDVTPEQFEAGRRG